MDPLSVSMAIVGLLIASWKISDVLSPLITKGKNAPKELQEMKTTVDTIRSVLSQLQLMLLGRMKVDRERTSLILVDQIVVTLSSCVSTFSDLDVFVETLGSDDNLGFMDRLRWASKTTIIQEHLRKLDVHKSSLTLMMTILTCESTYKAEDAVDQLSATVKILLDGHILIAERLSSIEAGLGTSPQPPQSMTPAFEPTTVQRDAIGFAFQEALDNSWVYKRSVARDPGGAFSIISAAGRTASWSMLSGLSLADNITTIAVQALPLYAEDICNRDIYQFGEFDDAQFEARLIPKVSSQDKHEKSRLSKLSIRDSLNRITTRVRRGSSTGDDEQAVIDQAISKPHLVFGVRLRTSITYAHVAISLMDQEGRSYIYGYVPIAVAKSGVYLKEKGTTVEHIFSLSGSAKRIAELQKVFDQPDRYGKGLNWAGYTVNDAACLLLRYLKLLPEPIIPFAIYNKFISCMDIRDGQNRVSNNPGNVITAFQGTVAQLPPLNRQLLLYILDMLAVFASKSDKNRMTPERLVAVFQPSLLSKEPQYMTADDHEKAAKTMVFMVENQDHFLIGMGDPVGGEASGTIEQSSTELGM